MQKKLQLPNSKTISLDDDVLVPFEERLRELDRAAGGPPPPCREAYAAAHVVLHRDVVAEHRRRVDEGHADKRRANEGRAKDQAEPIDSMIDWTATIGVRERIASHGFGIAEAMDTAQRYELGWTAAHRLIQETGKLGLERGFVAGASTDHLDDITDSDALADAWAWQANQIAAAGGTAVLLPQPALTEWKASEVEFVRTYSRVLEQVEKPVLLHWLGEMFHPAMRGYFPGASFEKLMARHPDKIGGAKLSLLDADLEREIRRRAHARGQILLTGDDFHFGDLIGGDGPDDFSHALLGILDGIARPAGVALRFLAHGDRATYDLLMGPCETLGQTVFENPTQHYKCGLAWIAWLNGWQDNPYLIDRVDEKRDTEHLLRITALASAAGCLEDAELAYERLHLAMVSKS